MRLAALGPPARAFAGLAGQTLERFGAAAGRVVELALELTGLRRAPEGSERPRANGGGAPPDTPPKRPRTTAPAGGAGRRAPAPVTGPGPRRSAPIDAPDPVAEPDEVVAESADAGAIDGAGASMTVAAPWTGYDRLRAPDVIDRLAGADQAELAVAELYERAHKNRSTVLAALARRLTEASAPARRAGSAGPSAGAGAGSARADG